MGGAWIAGAPPIVSPHGVCFRAGAGRGAGLPPVATSEDALLQTFKVALVFLTCVPLRLEGGVSMRDLAAAVHLFPIVGAMVGLVAGIACMAASGLGVPPLAAAIIGIGLAVVATGAIHEDGLADTTDALGARGDVDRALAIMRDSRIGSFGTVALILMLGARTAALAALLSPGLAIAGLMAAMAASRSLMPAVMLAQPSARADGLAATAGRPEPGRVLLGLGLAAAIAVLLLPAGRAFTALLLAGLVAAGLAAFLGRRFGGATGDTLGAVQQVAETAFLLVLAAGA